MSEGRPRLKNKEKQILVYWDTEEKEEWMKGERERERINVNLKECAKNSKSFLPASLFVCKREKNTLFVQNEGL